MADQCEIGVQSRITPPSVLARAASKFASGILRTAYEKWIEAGAALVTVAYQTLIQKPSTGWEVAQPYIWLSCIICTVHVVKAVCEVWREISQQPIVREVESTILLPDSRRSRNLIIEPRPSYFRATLIVILMGSLALLVLASYSVRRAAIASVRTYIYLVPTTELMDCQKRAFFIRTKGPQILYNVEITVKDNKSGQTHSESYPEIDPGSRSGDIHFWVVPSSPWDAVVKAKFFLVEEAVALRICN
jgi:hypothetical protein